MQRQSTKLVVNAASLIGRTIGQAAIALITTRIVIDALGTIDFGLFAMVGATVAFSGILNEAIAAAGGRQLGNELGRTGGKDLNRTFSTLLVIYAAIGALILTICTAIAFPLSRTLDVPPERADAFAVATILSALTLSILTARGSMWALIRAHQRQYLIAALDMVSITLRLGGAALLFVLPGDRLLLWSGIIAGSTLTVTAAGALVASRLQGFTLNTALFDRSQVKAITGFSSWILIGAFAARGRRLGQQTITLQVFSAAFNAGLGIAHQLSAYQSTLATPLRQTFEPAIMLHHGAGKTDLVRRLVAASTRYNLAFSSVIAIPLTLEPQALLTLWLGAERVADLPYAAELTRFLAIALLLQIAAIGPYQAISATGRLGAPVITRVTFEVLAITATAVHVGILGGPFIAVALWASLATGGFFVSSMFFAQRRAGISAAFILKEITLRALPVMATGFAVALAVQYAIPETPWRIIPVAAAGAAAMAFPGWLLIVRPEEKQKLLALARTLTNKVNPRR